MYFRQPSSFDAIENSLSGRSVTQLAFLVVAAHEVKPFVAFVAASAVRFISVAARVLSVMDRLEGGALDILVVDVDGGECGAVDGRFRGCASPGTCGDAGRRTVASTSAVGIGSADGNATLKEHLGLGSS